MRNPAWIAAPITEPTNCTAIAEQSARPGYADSPRPYDYVDSIIDMRLLLSCLFIAAATVFLGPVAAPQQAARAQLQSKNAERQFSEAYDLFVNRLYREAVHAFGAFRHAHPDHLNAADALYFEAEAALALGEEDEAVALFRKFERLYPMHPLSAKSRLALGKFFYSSGQHERAITVLEQVLEDEPGPENSAKALYWMGESALTLQQYDQALTYFRRAADEYRDTDTAPVALYAIAFTQVKREQYDAAAEGFELLAARYPQSSYAQNIGLALAEVYYELDDYERVISEINRRMPNLGPEARERAAFLLAESHNQLRNSDQAIVHYRRFTEDNPNSEYYRRALYGLAWNYYFEGVHQWAAEQFEQVRTVDDDLSARATYYEAVNQKLAKNPERALELWEEFLAKWPDHELARNALFELGVGYYEQRRWQRANEIFGQIVEEYPDSELVGEALYLKANTAVAEGEFEEALSNFDRAADLGAAPAELRDEVRFQRAWLQYRNGNYDAALDGFMEIYRANPRSDRGTESLFWAAESQFQLENLSQSVDLFTQYLREVPGGKHVDAAHYALGWAYFRQANYARAVDEFRTFLDQYRTAGESEYVPYRSDALLRLADSYYALKRYTDAIRTYRRVVDQAGDYAMYQIAQAFNSAGDAYEAVSAFRELLEKYPDSPWAEEARYNLGYAFFQNQDYDQAIEEYRALIRAHPNDPLAAKAQYGIGDALFNAGRSEDAVEAYREVLEEYPNSAYVSDAAAGVQYALIAMGDNRRAASIIDDFIASHPNSPVADELRFRKAEVNYQSGRTDQALRDLREFVGSSSNRNLLPDAYFYLGSIYDDREQIDQAVPYFQQVVDQFPGSNRFPDAARRLGRIYLDQERPRDALDVFRQLESSRSDDNRLLAEARYGQGMALIQLGRTEEAERLLRNAVDAAPEAQEALPAYLGLARVYEGAGRTQDAIRLYQQVVENSRDEIGAEALYRLGTLYCEQGNPRRAVDELGRMPVLFSGFTEWVARGFLEQARAFRQLGQTGDAVRLYDRVIEEYGGSTYARTAQQEKEAL